MRRLNQGLDRLLDLLAVVAGTLLILMMLGTVAKVGLRAFANHGILGIDQLSGILMVYITFIGAAWVLRNEGHVTVEILVAALGAAAQRRMQIAVSLLGAVACLSIAYFSTLTVLLSLSRGVVVAAELEIPRAVNLAVIPLGCFLLGIEFVRRSLRFYYGENAPSTQSGMEGGA